MRIVIFGASGSTGRLLTEQALAAGHQVVAVTRRPADFPIRHEQLSVVEADVRDGPAVDRAVDRADVVLSTLGVPFTRKPVTIYSDGIRNIIAAMSRHGVERVVVVTLDRHRAAPSCRRRCPAELGPPAAGQRDDRENRVQRHAADGGTPAGQRPQVDDHAPGQAV